MVECNGPLALVRQSGLLGVSRPSPYYESFGGSTEKPALMRRFHGPIPERTT